MKQLELLYKDEHIVVAIKPSGVKSTDEPGGMPELVRQALGDAKAVVKTVHRLDQVVSGLMVLARSDHAAAVLSQQIRQQTFQKEYLAVVHGRPEGDRGTMTDLLYRDKARRMTFVAAEMAKGVQEAVLDYRVVGSNPDFTRVAITLHTGRTHQIRVQFSSRNMPLVGERKYSLLGDDCPIALWSYRLGFCHPVTGRAMEFTAQPPEIYPWTMV